MSGHGWGPGDERKRAIADLANAMQGVAGVLDAMTRDELEALVSKLDTMHAIAIRTLAGRRGPSAEEPPASLGSGFYPKGSA